MNLVAIKFLEWDDAGVGNGTTLKHTFVVLEEQVEETVLALKNTGAFGIESSSPFTMVKSWR